MGSRSLQPFGVSFPPMATQLAGRCSRRIWLRSGAQPHEQRPTAEPQPIRSGRAVACQRADHDDWRSRALLLSIQRIVPTPSAADGKPPTKAMIAFAASIAAQRGLKLPRGLKSNGAICRAFLDQHAPSRSSRAGGGPAERGLALQAKRWCAMRGRLPNSKESSAHQSDHQFHGLPRFSRRTFTEGTAFSRKEPDCHSQRPPFSRPCGQRQWWTEASVCVRKEADRGKSQGPTSAVKIAHCSFQHRRIVKAPAPIRSRRRGEVEPNYGVGQGIAALTVETGPTPLLTNFCRRLPSLPARQRLKTASGA